MNCNKCMRTATNADPETVAYLAEQALGPGPVQLQLHNVYHLPVYQLLTAAMLLADPYPLYEYLLSSLQYISCSMRHC